MSPANWWVDAEWPVWRVLERWHVDPVALGWDVDRVLDANESIDVMEDVVDQKRIRAAAAKHAADLSRPKGKAAASRGNRKPPKASRR